MPLRAICVMIQTELAIAVDQFIVNINADCLLRRRKE